LRIIHGLQEALAAGLEKPVCTVGFFDGVHRGHSLVLEDLRNWAQEIEGTPTVITFDRHPKGIIGAGDPIPITPLEERLERLAGERVEVTILLPFDEELSRWSPERFIEEALVGAVGCRHLLMGFDSAFGAGARGTAEYLKSLPSLAVELRESRPVEVDGEPVSSTAIRKAVISGELDRAASLLGRPYGLRAPVISGERRGQMIGFPTANLDPGFVLVPPVGVYLGLARRQGKIWPAAINIGRRPTFGGEEEAEALEVVALETSELVGKPLREVAFQDAVIGAIVRGDDVIIPTGEDVIEVGDHVVIFALRSAIPSLERQLTVQLRYF